MSNLQVGKLCVCIKSHPCGIVKAGEIKEVLGLKKGACGCLLVDIGVIDPLFGNLPKMNVNCFVHGISNKHITRT